MACLSKIRLPLRKTVLLFALFYTLFMTVPSSAQAQTVTACEPSMFVATRLVSTINNYLECWYRNEFRPSLEDWTEHISVTLIEHIRMIGTFIDAQNTNKALITLQSEMLEAGRRYRPTDLGCIAGTGALGLTRANMGSYAMSLAMDRDFAARSTNVLGSPGAQGGAEFFAQLWDEYEDEFCDPWLNLGKQGATCTANTWRNGDILASMSLLANDTINDRGELRAVTALIRNIMEEGVASPMEENLFEGHQGKSTYLERRSATAIRQVAIHAATDIAGRRMPGTETGPWLKALLEQAGVPDGTYTINGRAQNYVSSNPSYHEMMRAMTKLRFADPEYFVRLSEDPEMAARDRVSNLAFKLMTLRDRYEMLEQLALIMALQLNTRFFQN